MVDYSELAAIRLGYGLSPRKPSPATPADLVAAISSAGPDRSAISVQDARDLQLQLAQTARGMNPDDANAVEARRLARRDVRTYSEQIQLIRFARAVGDAGGFGERLVQFWFDHFTVTNGTAVQSVMTAAYVDQAIRPNLTGRFADLMFAVETHPRMITYLNQDRSFGPNSPFSKRRRERNLGLNENLAREMIELHSLGVGADYAQRDVRQLAELLTGLTYSARDDRVFNPNMAEPGAETVLGVRYGGRGKASIDDIRAVIEDLAAHPATAAHISRKLAVHFIADDPPQELVDRLTQVWTDTGGDLSAMNLALAEAPELQTHFRQKLRQPFDFVVAALRGLGMGRNDVMALTPREFQAWLIRPMAGMGQRWGTPRGPDGWPEAAAAWATPQGLAARIDWAMRQFQQFVPEPPDPRVFMQASLGTTASEPLLWAVPKAESVREGLAVVLASADFNRR